MTGVSCRPTHRGAEQPEFAPDRQRWRNSSVPHDWVTSPDIRQKRTKPKARAVRFCPAARAGIAKHFLLPESYSRDHVRIEFDGVMAHSNDVWINGYHLRPASVRLRQLRLRCEPIIRDYGDQENVLSVRADNSAQPGVTLVFRQRAFTAMSGWSRRMMSTSRRAGTVREHAGSFDHAGDGARADYGHPCTQIATPEITLQTSLLAPDEQNRWRPSSPPPASPMSHAETVTQQIKDIKAQLWNLGEARNFTAP